MRLLRQLLHYIIVAATMVTAQNNTTTTVPAMSPISIPTSVVLTESPSLITNQTCFTNLTEIELKIQSKDPFVEETYVLCPNTVFVIRTDKSTAGANPIVLRANCIFKCGNDGKSANGCVLSGGSFQVISSSGDFASENKVGIVFQGITFDAGSVTSALLVAPGDVTFIDCIFQVRMSDCVANIITGCIK